MQMSVIQRSATILKRFLRIHSNNLLKYGTIADKMLDDSDDHLVWIDMEMTGLDIETDHIMEVACLITDAKLKIVSDDFNVIINTPDHLLENMNEWCTKQHGKSGLTNSCRSSKISLEAAEHELLQFVKRYVPEGKCPVAGNSVYMDRLFLRKYMPVVNDYLHYRIVDTSSIKELVRRWNSEAYKNTQKKSFSHRAIEDIRESIAELEYYRNNVFRTSDCQS